VSVIHPPDTADTKSLSGLSEGECAALHGEAYRLMVDGRSLGVGAEVQDNGDKMVFVLDGHGNRFTVTRNAGAYLILDPAFGIIAVFVQFSDAMEELASIL
jgi:hypothetical protein